jgi:hypothetical protein
MNLCLNLSAHARPWPGDKLLFGQGHALFPLTGRRAITQVIACTLGLDRNLGCSDGTNLDFYGVMAATTDFGMVIITLSRLYSM